jgi:hypothetical protein
MIDDRFKTFTTNNCYESYVSADSEANVPTLTLMMETEILSETLVCSNIDAADCPTGFGSG